MVPSSYCVVLTSHMTVFLSHFVFSYFFSYLIIPSLHCAVLTSHVTILLSHSVVLFFFFSYLIVQFLHYTVLTLHLTIILSYSVVLFFFLTFDYTILILCSTNITYNCTFVTFSDSFFFSHIRW